MTYDSRYSLLDRPEILQFAFYPRQEVQKGPPNSTDHFVPVENGISVACRFYVHSHGSPSVLFFHGNGEVVSDYDVIASFYTEIGINLFVAGYRGYGASGGTPTFTSMVTDAHGIFEAFLDVLRSRNHTGDVFLMGRSLGSIPVVELAHSHQEQVEGLIIESGCASLLRLLKHLGFPAERLGIDDVSFPNAAKMRSITLPTLILHGEYDNIIPVTEARDLFENSAAETKRLVIIHQADHNNIMLVGMKRYFAEIAEFVSPLKHEGAEDG